MNLKELTLHKVTPRTEDSCMESHIILSPAYTEAGKTYSLFRIFKNMNRSLYVRDDSGDGICLRLHKVHTETIEHIPVLNEEQAPNSIFSIRVYSLKNNLPSIVELERIPYIPDEVLFADYEDLFESDSDEE